MLLVRKELQMHFKVPFFSLLPHLRNSSHQEEWLIQSLGAFIYSPDRFFRDFLLF